MWQLRSRACRLGGIGPKLSPRQAKELSPPEGLVETAIGENVVADNAMSRRASCLYGGLSVAGARRAMVISPGASMSPEEARVAAPIGSLHREMRALAEAGAATLVRGPRKVDSATLMCPPATCGGVALTG